MGPRNATKSREATVACLPPPHPGFPTGLSQITAACPVFPKGVQTWPTILAAAQ